MTINKVGCVMILSMCSHVKRLVESCQWVPQHLANAAKNRAPSCCHLQACDTQLPARPPASAPDDMQARSWAKGCHLHETHVNDMRFHRLQTLCPLHEAY